jgi:hypothetical protein
MKWTGLTGSGSFAEKNPVNPVFNPVNPVNFSFCQAHLEFHLAEWIRQRPQRVLFYQLFPRLPFAQRILRLAFGVLPATPAAGVIRATLFPAVPFHFILRDAITISLSWTAAARAVPVRETNKCPIK